MPVGVPLAPVAVTAFVVGLVGVAVGVVELYDVAVAGHGTVVEFVIAVLLELSGIGPQSEVHASKEASGFGFEVDEVVGFVVGSVVQTLVEASA